MPGKEVWFRSGDGREHCCNEGSVAHGLMKNDGSFVEISGPGGEAAPAAPAADEKQDLSKLSKKQLYGLAVERDVPVTDKMSKAEIVAALEAAENAGESGDGE